MKMLAIPGDDPRRLLPAMLERVEAKGRMGRRIGVFPEDSE